MGTRTLMRKRVVEDEWLDRLPPNDPAAIRSRADLRRINFVMGNERWITRVVREFPDAAQRGIVELGAGDGVLSLKIAREFPQVPVTAYDLAPPPDREALHSGCRIDWRVGDIFQQPAPTGGILVANLFLHHFEGNDLKRLGAWCDGFEVLVFNEPNRAWLPLWLGTLAWPFIHPVTRHDMPVSIRAGFREGEIPALMGLAGGGWKFRESSSFTGARRVLALRA